MEVINLDAKFALFSDRWHPRIVAELNGQHVKLARLEGPFEWHSHPGEDELFLVLEGALRMEFRDGERVVRPGELIVVPRGVEHRPVAAEGEVRVLLFEPTSTVNTGDRPGDRTAPAEWV